MSALTRQLAIVSESQSVPLAEAMRVSAALQKQATRDLAPIWEISATVDAFATLEDVPIGYWPILVQDDIGFDAAGIHLDKDGQPFALVTAGDDWALTASHEALEMLVDPFGNRTIAGDSPKPDQGRVEFLVEVSDPSEAAEFGYNVNGVLVSDFYTPRFFDPIHAPGVRYSFTGAITEPRQVRRGGYLSWHEPVSDDWWQLQFFSGSPKFVKLGPMSAKNGTLRSQIDRLTEASAAAYRKGNAAVAVASKATTAMIHGATTTKASSLRAQIDTILGKGSATSLAQTEKVEIRRARRIKGD